MLSFYIFMTCTFVIIPYHILSEISVLLSGQAVPCLYRCEMSNIPGSRLRQDKGKDIYGPVNQIFKIKYGKLSDENTYCARMARRSAIGKSSFVTEVTLIPVPTPAIRKQTFISTSQRRASIL